MLKESSCFDLIYFNDLVCRQVVEGAGRIRAQHGAYIC